MEEISHVIGPPDLSEKDKMTIGYNSWLKTLAERTEIYGQVIKELEAQCAKKGSFRQRLAFPFRKGTYDVKIREIRWFVTILNNFLGVLHARKTMRLEVSMRALLNMEESRQLEHELDTALSLLLPGTRVIGEINNKIYEELEHCHRSPQLWILQEPQYLEWVHGSQDASKTSSKCLWAHGRQGAGKTCLASVVAYHLSETEHHLKPSASFGDRWFFATSEDSDPTALRTSLHPLGKSSSSVSLVNCNYRESVKQGVDSILRVLCRQLYDQLRTVDAQTAHKHLDTLKFLKDPKAHAQWLVKALLNELLQEFATSYIVIDALDENSDVQGIGVNLR